MGGTYVHKHGQQSAERTQPWQPQTITRHHAAAWVYCSCGNSREKEREEEKRARRRLTTEWRKTHAATPTQQYTETRDTYERHKGMQRKGRRRAQKWGGAGRKNGAASCPSSRSGSGNKRLHCTALLSAQLSGNVGQHWHVGGGHVGARASTSGIGGGVVVSHE